MLAAVAPFEIPSRTLLASGATGMPFAPASMTRRSSASRSAADTDCARPTPGIDTRTPATMARTTTILIPLTRIGPNHHDSISLPKPVVRVVFRHRRVDPLAVHHEHEEVLARRQPDDDRPDPGRLPGQQMRRR